MTINQRELEEREGGRWLQKRRMETKGVTKKNGEREGVKEEINKPMCYYC